MLIRDTPEQPFMTDRQTMLRRKMITTICLLALFGIMIAGLTQHSFNSRESFNAAAITDTARQPDSIREALRYVRDSLLDALDRAGEQSTFPVYQIALDGWQIIAGDSDFSLRLPSVLTGLISLAVIITLCTRIMGHQLSWTLTLALGTSAPLLMIGRTATGDSLYLMIGLIGLYLVVHLLRHQMTTIVSFQLNPILLASVTSVIMIAQLWVYPFPLSAPSDYRSAVEQASSQRSSSEPALITVNQAHPLAYHVQQIGLIDGISIDLSWRAFTDDEIHFMREQLATTPVIWLILDMTLPLSQDVLTIFNNERDITTEIEINGIRLLGMQAKR